MSSHLIQFSDAEKRIREAIVESLNLEIGEENKIIISDIEYTPNSDFGDFTFSCFNLAKVLKKSPAEIAKQLSEKIKLSEQLEKCVATGPYLNFFSNKKLFVEEVLAEIYKKGSKFGEAKFGKGERVMVEYYSPNTNKPLTIGHARNIFLGWTISRLLKFTGHKVIEATLYNDRGIALAKTIVAYQKWGKNSTPKTEHKKSDHFVGDWYVRFGQEAKTDPNLEKEATKTLQAWEDDKKEVKQVWQKLIEWVLEGYAETLNRLKIGKFDEEFFESEYYQEGKAIVLDGLKKGIFKKHADGYIYAELEEFGMPNKVLLRSDGTSLYITQDIYLATLKDRHRVTTAINVVGSEQELQFKQLFKILELLQPKHTQRNFHLSYGMVRLPSGKIKSREGLIKGTGIDDLLSGLEKLAKLEIKKRNREITEEEIQKRASEISLGALKFYLLAVSPASPMVFDPQKSIAFNGRTGPYIQYVHTRIASMLKKSEVKISKRVDLSLLSHPVEFALIKELSKFPVVISESVNQLDPSKVSLYLFELSKAFTVFYEQLSILKADESTKKARLFLVHNVNTVLETGLNLLGVPAPDEM